jgi:transglutaminase-like putative cysteine protease
LNDLFEYENTMAASDNEEINIRLIIDRQDVIVHRQVRGTNPGPTTITGLQFSTGLEIDGANAFFGNHQPIKATLQTNKHTVEITFPKPIGPGQTYFYELQQLLNPQYLQKMGNLNILDWPKEDLSQIVFLPNAGKIFFSSALGQIILDPKTKYRIITPGPFARKLVSHGRKASTLRIEWGIPPTITIRHQYRIVNSGSQPATEITLRTFIPPTTKFQSVTVPNTLPGITFESDADNNQIAVIQIGSIPGNQEKMVSFQLSVQPQGNVGVIMPFFGTWPEFRDVTQPNSIGEQMLAPSKYWNLDDGYVKDLVAVLKKSAKNASEFIQLAFEFTNQRLTYEINNFRETAARTLQSRKGDCSEFSDIFVTILRAAGIPAKVVHGWTIDLEKNTLNPHAWCEFFSPQRGWLACDPTWGFLTGVSCQHIARHPEGLVLDQNTFSWQYRGNTEIKVSETLQIIGIR